MLLKESKSFPLFLASCFHFEPVFCTPLPWGLAYVGIVTDRKLMVEDLYHGWLGGELSLDQHLSWCLQRTVCSKDGHNNISPSRGLLAVWHWEVGSTFPSLESGWAHGFGYCDIMELPLLSHKRWSSFVHRSLKSLLWTLSFWVNTQNDLRPLGCEEGQRSSWGETTGRSLDTTEDGGAWLATSCSVASHHVTVATWVTWSQHQPEKAFLKDDQR